MALKKQLLSILERSGEAQKQFGLDLGEEQRQANGTYEKWSAKDSLAHIGYWEDHQAVRLEALARGEEPPPGPAHYEQANAACFARYSCCTWDEVESLASKAHARLTKAVHSLDEKALAAPAEEGEERPLWMQVVGTAYTHPLMHIAGYVSEQGRLSQAGELWKGWGKDVAKLDSGAEWQGLVRYNLACSLALLGDRTKAVAELRKALELKPSLKAWSRQDTDLASLHDMREYKQLFAAEHWWRALDAGPQSEALADQFMRVLGMLRQAVEGCPEAEWRAGEAPCDRPAALALHALDSLYGYCALKAGECADAASVDWEEKDLDKLPSPQDLLAHQERVERQLASFLAQAQWEAPEELFRWTGSTVLSRAGYILRHTQHHVGELCRELHRRGHKAPDWQ